MDWFSEAPLIDCSAINCRATDIQFWIDEEAIKAWIAPYLTTPGGQRKFSNFAIEATLILGAVFKMPLRQTEGFVRSLMEIMGLDLPVPDHTTLARRRRTVEVEMHASGRSAPVDLVLDSTGLKFYGAPFHRNCVSTAGQWVSGPARNTVKRAALGANCTSQWTQALAKSWLMSLPTMTHPTRKWSRL